MPEYIYYKIICKDENIKEIYIGKTKNFKMRIYKHKSNCYNENRKEYNLKVCQYIRENGGWNNFDMIEIEKGEYDEKNSAIKERELIEKFNANLNIDIPTRTRKEYRENNKEIINEYQKEYRENNIEKIKEYFKEYRENNKEKIKEYRENNKEILNEYLKDYRKNNKEIIKEKKKRYYEKNAEIINEKITCQCNCEILKRYLSKHLKTKKHIKFLALTADII
jgi:vacuolar-type H+-ATPase subunit H